VIVLLFVVLTAWLGCPDRRGDLPGTDGTGNV